MNIAHLPYLHQQPHLPHLPHQLTYVVIKPTKKLKWWKKWYLVTFRLWKCFLERKFLFGTKAALSLFLHPLQLCLFHLSTPPSTQQPHRQGHLARRQHLLFINLTFDCFVITWIFMRRKNKFNHFGLSMLPASWRDQQTKMIELDRDLNPNTATSYEGYIQRKLSQ